MAELSRQLSDAERAFLQDLFRETVSVEETADAECLLEIDPSTPQSRLLLTLLSRMNGVLLAEDSRYQLRFKVDVVAAPFGGPARLRLATPEVFDRDGVSRAVRVTADDEIGVRDPSGKLQPVRVENISDTGVALTVREPAKPGTRVPQLEIALPGRPPMQISGRVVRVKKGDSADHQLVIAFDHIEPKAREAVRRYVFDRYSSE